MGRGTVIAGVVLLVIGLLLIAGGYYVNAANKTASAAAGEVLTLSPSTLGSASLSLSWSGAGSGSTVYVITGTPTCTSPSGIVAQGSGDSGSLTASLSSGNTYSIYACNGGNGAAANFTYSATGLSYLMVGGIVLALIGVILAVVGRRGSAKPAPAAAPPS